MLILFLLVTTVTSAIICHWIARRRGANAVLWACLGLAFGPLAIPFVLLSRSRAH